MSLKREKKGKLVRHDNKRLRTNNIKEMVKDILTPLNDTCDTNNSMPIIATTEKKRLHIGKNLSSTVLTVPETHAVNSSMKLHKTCKNPQDDTADSIFKYNKCISHASDLVLRKQTVRRTKEKTLTNTSSNNKISRIKSAFKSEQSAPRSKLKPLLRKFSKSPKIVLKLKNSKSHISNPRKVKQISSIKNKHKDYMSEIKTIKSTKKNVPLRVVPFKTLSPSNAQSQLQCSIKKEQKLLCRKSLNTKIADKISPLRMTAMLSTPRVVLEKLSPSYISKFNSKIKVSLTALPKQESNETVDALNNTVLKGAFSTSKENSPIINTQIVQREKSPMDGLNITSEPLLSSTPQDENIHLFKSNFTCNSTLAVSPKTSNSSHHVKIDCINTNCVVKLFFNDTIKGRTPSKNEQTIKSRSGTSNILQKQKQENAQNDTYEVLLPVTPNLRQKCRKRSSLEAAFDTKKGRQKLCKIQCTRAEPNVDTTINNTPEVNQLPASTHIKHLLQDKSVLSHEASVQKNFKHNRVHINSVSITSKKRSSTSVPIKSEIATEQLTQAITRQFDSLSSTVQKCPKTLSAKRAPNFARIHQKAFDNMESIMDEKKRIMERHMSLTMSKVSSQCTMKCLKNRISSKVTNDEICDRFGHKFKKGEAIQSVMKKRHFTSRLKQQEENRALLKGVRTNRRFELQMKWRNANL